MKTPKAQKMIDDILKENKQRLSIVYLDAEIHDKIHKILTENNMYVSVNLFSAFQIYYHPLSDETRSLTHIAWQMFEYIDEVLNLTDIKVNHEQDIQHFDISGLYTESHRVRLTICYSGLKTCKVEYVEELVEVAKTVCV